jgi:hypothetical protein
MADRQADEVVRVATVFNAAEFGVTRSFLAAHGILIAAEPIHLINNYSHLATALGGIPILVPASQAGEAAELLIEVEEAGHGGRISPFRRLAYILLFGVLCGLGIAPPSSGRVIHCRRTALAQGFEAV